jgi:hypothetical protein
VSCSRRQSLTRLRSQSRCVRDWTGAQRVEGGDGVVEGCSSSNTQGNRFNQHEQEIPDVRVQFPSLISGKLSNTFSLPQIAFGYGVLALGATLFTVLGARNPHTDATGNSTCDSFSTLDDAAAAFNATERRAGTTIIRVRP